MAYELEIKSIQEGATQNKFDLYLFSGNDQDYNCFVMGAQLWTDYGVKHECDFLKMRPDVVKHAILEYSESSETFLNHENKESEVFAVVDNSGWYTAITNPQVTQEEASALDDVYFSINVTSYYKDNDIYNSVYSGFLAAVAVVSSLLVISLIMLKCLRMKYNKLMLEKAEFKQ